LGIDACEEFLEEARHKASDWGVSSRCRFELRDMRLFIKQKEAADFDVVVFASLGGLLGDFRELAGKLRRTVYPGGYMVIDDGFLTGEESVRRPGYGHYVPHVQALEQLTSHGDTLVEERLTIEENLKINQDYLAILKENARTLLQGKPELAVGAGIHPRPGAGV
jgi:hypothetical protein